MPNGQSIKLWEEAVAQLGKGLLGGGRSVTRGAASFEETKRRSWRIHLTVLEIDRLISLGR